MTVVLTKPEAAPWSSMPGWGVVADLTPPELVESRRLRVLRRLVVAGLVVVVLVCVGGLILARRDYAAADAEASAATDRTSQLTSEQGKYAEVTQVHTAIDDRQGQLDTLLATDVDMARLLTRLGGVLPSTMTLTAINVSLNATADPTVTATGTDSIGTVSLTGTSTSLTDLASYVSALNSLPGVAEVVPTSNAAVSGSSGSWSATLQLTEKLYRRSHSATATTGTPSGGGN